MFRKRRRPTPDFKIPPPFNPIQGGNANLRQDGTTPYCAMMQVAAEDTYDDYVICRGFDPRILRFIDYADGDSDKPGISVAKPYGNRTTGTYNIAEIYPALLPTQGNAGFGLEAFRQTAFMPPSPVAVEWRVGQNPGKVTGGGADGGQPEALSDAIEILYDHNGKVVNWILVDSAGDEKGKIAYEVTAAEVISDTGDQFDGLMKLTVTVKWARQSALVTTSVTVYDWSPCLANAETPAALVGRFGWAAWGVGEDQSAAAEAGDLTDFHWGCDGLCCP